MITTELDRQSMAEFKRALAQYEKKTGISIEDAIIEMAKSTGRRLAHTVPPYGLSPQVGRKFMESIGNQVDYAWFGSTRGVFPSNSMEAAHKAARNSRGQVVMRKLKETSERNNNISVADKEIYKRKIMRNAGIAKAGWVAAAEKSISGQSMTASGSIKKLSGIAKWIRRHVKDRLGEARITRRGISSSVDLTNNVSYISGLHKKSEIAKAIKQGYNNAIRRVNHIINGTKRNQTI